MKRDLLKNAWGLNELKINRVFLLLFFVEKHATYDAKRNIFEFFFRFVMRIAPFFARTMLQGWQKEYYIKLSNYISWKIHILCVANVIVFASEQNLLWNHLKTNKLTFISCCHKSQFKKWKIFSFFKIVYIFNDAFNSLEKWMRLMMTACNLQLECARSVENHSNESDLLKWADQVTMDQVLNVYFVEFLKCSINSGIQFMWMCHFQSSQ